MLSGVTLVGPETIFVDEGVEVGADTTLLPFTSLGAGSVVGAGCEVGPHATILRSRLGDGVVVRSSTIEDSVVEARSHVGPYAHLRAGTEVGPGVHVGNFAELKNARLASGVKVGHFSYLGDASVGTETNIGAGTITANYDGERKHRTEIGERVFVGSDTIFRAPVRVGDGARTGAGSVVTRDVPENALAVGVPARIRGPRDEEKGEGGPDGEGRPEPSISPSPSPRSPQPEDA
jgi:bifunctional UDP-N-acetylglucosamine pyrophosphorylase/glucosamine-1-phosphate N-acetyltransferase